MKLWTICWSTCGEVAFVSIFRMMTFVLETSCNVSVSFSKFEVKVPIKKLTKYPKKRAIKKNT